MQRKVYFQFAERSLLYAKIGFFSETARSSSQNFSQKVIFIYLIEYEYSSAKMENKR